MYIQHIIRCIKSVFQKDFLYFHIQCQENIQFGLYNTENIPVYQDCQVEYPNCSEHIKLVLLSVQ